MEKFRAEYAASLRAEAARLRSLVSRTEAMVVSNLMGPQLAGPLKQTLDAAAEALDQAAQAVSPRADAR
jgi:hypothetical protein